MSWWSLFSCVRLNSTQCVRKHFTAGCCSPHAPSIQLINNEEEELGSRKKRTIILMVRDKDIQVLSRYFKKSIRSHKTQSCTAAPSARLNLAPPGRNHIEHFFHTCLMTSVPIILVYAPLLGSDNGFEGTYWVAFASANIDYCESLPPQLKHCIAEQGRHNTALQHIFASPNTGAR